MGHAVLIVIIQLDECPVGAEHRVGFTLINSCTSHNNPVGLVLLLSPFHRWENRGLATPGDVTRRHSC